jgi:hypothetical protein
MARIPYSVGRNEFPDIANSRTPATFGSTGIEGRIPEPTLGTGQRMPAPLTTGASPLVGAPVPSTTDQVQRMGSSPEIEAIAPAKMVTGSNQRLISDPPAAIPSGAIKSVGGMGYQVRGAKGPSTMGRFPTHQSAVAGYNKANQPPVYRESLTTNTGVDIPIGSTGQTPQQQLQHPGAMAAIGREGSIPDIQNAQRISGMRAPGLTPDVAAAVDSTVIPKNLAPIRKRGR